MVLWGNSLRDLPWDAAFSGKLNGGAEEKHQKSPPAAQERVA